MQPDANDLLRMSFLLVNYKADGLLSKAELQAALHPELDMRFPGVTDEAVANLAELALRAADEDGDGFLSADEFLQSFHRGPGSGVLGWDAINRIVQNVGRILRPPDVDLLRYVFGIGDTNRDGVLDAAELRALLVPHLREQYPEMSGEEYTGMVQMIIESADIDGDGVISLYEFFRSFAMDQGVLPPELVSQVKLPLADSDVDQLTVAISALPQIDSDMGAMVDAEELRATVVPLLQDRVGPAPLPELLVESALAGCRQSAQADSGGRVSINAFLQQLRGEVPLTTPPPGPAFGQALSAVPDRGAASEGQRAVNGAAAAAPAGLSEVERMVQELVDAGRLDDAAKGLTSSLCDALLKSEPFRARDVMAASPGAVGDLLCLASVSAALRDANAATGTLLGGLFTVILPGVAANDLRGVATVLSRGPPVADSAALCNLLQSSLVLMERNGTDASAKQWEALTAALMSLQDTPDGSGSCRFAALCGALTCAPAAGVALALRRAFDLCGCGQDLISEIAACIADGQVANICPSADALLQRQPIGAVMRDHILGVLAAAVAAFGGNETGLAVAQVCRSAGVSNYATRQAKRVSMLLGQAGPRLLHALSSEAASPDELSRNVFQALTDPSGASPVAPPTACYVADVVVATALAAGGGGSALSLRDFRQTLDAELVAPLLAAAPFQVGAGVRIIADQDTLAAVCGGPSMAPHAGSDGVVVALDGDRRQVKLRADAERIWVPADALIAQAMESSQGHTAEGSVLSPTEGPRCPPVSPAAGPVCGDELKGSMQAPIAASRKLCAESGGAERKELAAVRIQSAIRCHLARAERRRRAAAVEDCLSVMALESDPDTAAAATKIQAMQRGRAARKETKQRSAQRKQRAEASAAAEAAPAGSAAAATGEQWAARAAHVPAPPPPRADPVPGPRPAPPSTPPPGGAQRARSPSGDPYVRPATAPPYSAVRQRSAQLACAPFAHDVSGCAVTNEQQHGAWLEYEWRKFEKAGTGYASRSEFRQAYLAMEWCGLQPGQRELDKMFREPQVAGDDRLCFDEFCLLMLHHARI
eukprot:TRINITY_DN23860_c0_g1_i1.p1 TRINITY_DN23860_c0_g1~~TRINITY_DN23860_c0_g1_i1.p1  ORF type:complete len:1082 (+),score=320.61 TRINITY_DN23860_c0_g1_i1:80-3247(+)